MVQDGDASANRPRPEFRETERWQTRNTTSKFDWTLVASGDEQVVGTMSLMTDIDSDEPWIYVRMVRSAQPGVASAMLDELVRRYPEHFVHGGPVTDHEPGGRQLLRRRLARGLSTIHTPGCSRDSCVCVEQLRPFEKADSLAERRFHEFDVAESRRLGAE